MSASIPFPIRGFHLDLRVQVMRPTALHRFADELAALGCNTLIMEWEASFPYRRHATVAHERAYTPAQVRAFLRHCRRLGLTVIPLQQSLGHLEHVLRHPRYAHLREDAKDLCQLCPRKIDAARTLVRELLADLRELHDGEWIHLGGDEAYLLGHCPECRAFVARHGLSRLYAECMSALIEDARSTGWKPIIWADMMLKHPECLDLLPRDTVIIDWNYGWAADRFGPPETLRQHGFTVWGAAALRSNPDNHSLTHWAKHLNNFRDFLPQAAHAGYTGMILTSWSTSGVFGYWLDGAADDVLDILPVRRVYPLNGHRLLLVAFAEALENLGAFSPDDFLHRYAAERFGFRGGECHRFARALFAQTPEASKAPASRDRLATLQPRRHATEFAHLRLIEAFRWQYVTVQTMREQFQRQEYSRARAPGLLRRLEPLRQQSNQLERTYRQLHRDYLHPAEIAADTAYRQKALLNLHGALMRQSAR